MMIAICSAQSASARDAGPVVLSDRGFESGLDIAMQTAGNQHDNDALSPSAYHAAGVTADADAGGLGSYAFGDLEAWALGLPKKIVMRVGETLKPKPETEVTRSETDFLLHLGSEGESGKDVYSATPKAGTDSLIGGANSLLDAIIGFAF